MKTQIRYLACVCSAALLSACTATETSNNNQAISNTKASFNVNTQVQAPSKTLAKPSGEQIALTLEQIMSDPDWLGRQAESPSFSADGQYISYSRKQAGSVLRERFIADPLNAGNGEKVALSEQHLYDYDQRIDDEDSEYIAWLFEGNVFAMNKRSKQVKQLTKSSAGARNLAFLNDDAVSFQRGDTFYAVNMASGMQKELLSWQFADKPEAVEAPKDHVAKEQLRLIKYVQVQRENRQVRADAKVALQQANSSMIAAPVYLPKGHTTVVASLSPDGKWAVIATREDLPTRNDTDIMPDYIQEDGRIKAQSARQRVADAKSQRHQLWLVELATSSAKELEYIALPGYNEDVLADEKRENAQARGEQYENNRLPRDIGLLFGWYASEMPIKWHDNSDKVALMLEAWDNKDRWIVSVDVDDARLVNQHRMHDDAWVNYRYNQFGWFDNSETLYLLSEQSGYSQLYTKALTGELNAITQGQFVVDDVTLSKDDRYFYYKANKKHPGIYEVYRTRIDDGKTEALTDLNGMTDFVLSPNEDTLLLTHSTLTRPPELYGLALHKAELQQNTANNTDINQPVKITDTISAEFKSIDWVAPSIVAVPSSHTQQAIYARVYQGASTTESAGTTSENSLKPAVVFNHGAGYLQNAHLGWSGYFREFMFHSFLVSKGYVVLDMDYRASAGYGRDWRTAIYRQMGTPEVQDLQDGVNWLVENANVDRQRIGTYGGSYGGFLTFMALFNEPDLFQAGAALRPVSDWAHYNTAYTANILNTPDIDPLAYERSSPIYHAEGLTKPLLINAPMVDDNVFFVDVVRLVQRLIELEKQDFETAIYPVEPHGFVQPSSWLDEYRRIFKLFQQHL